jgi:hypothetical protein
MPVFATLLSSGSVAAASGRSVRSLGESLGTNDGDQRKMPKSFFIGGSPVFNERAKLAASIPGDALRGLLASNRLCRRRCSA